MRTMPYDESKLTEIFRTVFNMPDLVLTDTLTAHDVPGWDSFNHVNLVITIETEFDVRFTTDEVAALENVGELKKLLKQKLQSG
jgi:acyl carrier protein